MRLKKQFDSAPCHNTMKNTKKLYCKKCKEKTEHILCGFGLPGGLIGNARWRCKNCGEERI